jgi:Lon protease-like protein
LTATLPIFPLSGVLLLPGGHLPLNIFEPRYLAMVDAALSGSRLIGMIQPTMPENAVAVPELTAVGCAGRLVSYRETEDGRMLITLKGICRFRVIEELKTTTPYRQVRTDYTPYADDLVEETPADFPRDRLTASLKVYLSRRDLKADWESVLNAPPDVLVNALAMLCPFEPAEKQAILEAAGWSERVETLITLLEMASASSAGGATVN